MAKGSTQLASLPERRRRLRTSIPEYGECGEQADARRGLLALLGALYEPHVRTIAVRGGLAGYTSILDDSFAYIAADVTVPGFLEAGDLADVEASLSPMPILLEDLIGGKNRVILEHDLRSELEPLYGANRETSASRLDRADHGPKVVEMAARAPVSAAPRAPGRPSYRSIGFFK
jgi:hypothetical protein